VPQTAPDQFGSYACSYCEARFQLKPAMPAAGKQSAKAVASPWLGAVLFFVGLLLVVVALGAVASIAAQRRQAAPAKPAFAGRGLEPLSSASAALGPHDPRDPKATAEFELQGRKSGSQSSFYLLGMVKNTSSFAIDKPKVVVVLKDKTGKELANRAGYAESDVLQPGESSPVQIRISDPPAHDQLAFEVSAWRALSDPGKAVGLKVEQDGPARQNFATWEVSGKVSNEGSVPARFVKVELLIKNQAGKLIGIERAYIDAEELAPHESSRFRASVQLDEKPDKIELSVSALPGK
jgi:hypothetical protein